MRIFVSVGEPSGDLHGSNLIREMHRRRADIRFVGFGGHKMKAAGCQLDADMTELSIMGVARVVPHLKRFWGLLQHADRCFRAERPTAVVLIDYPGFNWWVARRAKRHGIPVFYYGTPQIWGWATHRVRKLRKLVDHALCKLPFEPDWYRQRDCQATYVGHPYFDEFTHRDLDERFLRRFSDSQVVTVLPGSRKQEVSANLPAFLRTIDHVHQQLPRVRFAIANYNDDQAAITKRIIRHHRVKTEVEIHVNRTRELMHRATCCLACSGSVSLELLHEAKPTVIHYRIDPFGDFLQRRFRRCKFITLVNLLTSDRRFNMNDSYDPDDLGSLDEAPFPEYLTVGDRSADMARHLIRWLTNENARQQIIDRLSPLRDSFAKPGASQRAADYILGELESGNVRPALPTRSKVA